MGVSGIELLVAVLVTLGAALIQGTIGIGFNIISVPILALIDPRLAPVPQLVISLPLSIATYAREPHSVDFKGVGWILAGRFPGAALGLGLLVVASATALDLLLASFVLVAVGVLATGWQLPPVTAHRFWGRHRLGRDRPRRIHGWTAASAALLS